MEDSQKPHGLEMKIFLKRYLLFFVLIAFILLLGSYLLFYSKITQTDTIKVGILFPTTGAEAISGEPAAKGVLLAIEEINKSGGIKGKKIVPISYNPNSDPNLYGQYTKRLILEDEVSAIFGCLTSASRKVVKPIVEQYENLLIYPAPYEGIEDSKNIIYIGAIPNQQIVPAISLMILKGYKRFFILGSNYIYTYVANEIISHEITSQGGKIVGVSYIPFGKGEVDEVIKQVQLAQPEVIVNVLSGEDNIIFFKKLNKISPRPIVLSFNVSDEEINEINPLNMVNDYFSWTYYPTIKNEENRIFRQAYKKKYGSVDDVDANTINAYKSVYLWEQGVEQSPDNSPPIVRDFMLRTSVGSPSGIIYLDPLSGQAWRNIIISKIEKNGDFSTVWHSSNPIPPIIYPTFKTKAEWNLLEYQLYVGWGNSWKAND